LEYGYGIDHRVGIGVTEDEVGKLQSGGVTIGGKHEVIMLEGDRPRTVATRFRRGDSLIQQSCVA
jgi:hypothetical protein